MKKSVIFMAVIAVMAVASAQSLLHRPLSRQKQPNRGAQPPNREVPSAKADVTINDPGGRSIEFDNTPLDMVFTVYGELVGKTVLKDPATPTVNISLHPQKGQELSQEEKILAIETVLEMNGIHLEPYGDKFMRAIPRANARKEAIPLIMDPEAILGESTKVVSLMYKFINISVEEAQKALEELKTEKGKLVANERTNSILITDTEANINRMREFARAIDIATPVAENTFIYQVEHASANDIKTALEAIVQESQKELEKSGKVPTTQQPQRRFGLPNKQQPQQTANESVLTAMSDADRGMIRGKVLILADERSNKLVIITSKTNYDAFEKIIKALDVETTPDTVVKVYRLKYAEAEDVSDMINDLIGNAPSSKGTSRGNQNQNAKGKGGGGAINRQQQPKKSVNQRAGEAKTGELSKDNTTVLADERINGLVVMTNKDLVPILEDIIESMDIKLSQVLIETMIIEVTLGDELATGMDWVQNGRQKTTVASTDQAGNPTYATKRTITDTKGNTSTSYDYSKLVNSGYSTSYTDVYGNEITEEASSLAGTMSQVTTDGALNYYTAGTATAIGGGQGGQMAYNIASGATSNLFGKALNFVFTSDELGLTAILQATKTDSRTKYVASPVIMTLDNKEATINATQMRYLLKGFTSSGNSYSTIAVPDYEQKELGIEIKATPKINPNGTVMLNVEEKYTQLGNYQTIQYATGSGGSGNSALQDIPVPTTITREMSSDVLLENNQTVVFAGLTETTKSESESGIPWLKDIPWIGKWLFGTVEQNEYRTELLVFMTPYVLTDAEAAQLEAIRRKNTMSDSRPWEDRGWSASELADPVSKKELMRRLKDEWKKQDEERETQKEIEKAKLERVKALKAMSKNERDAWLELHAEELKEEEKKELEEKMLDDKSQEELRKLADQVKARKLKEANKAIEDNAKSQQTPNERAKLDAEKQAKGVTEPQQFEKVEPLNEVKPIKKSETVETTEKKVEAVNDADKSKRWQAVVDDEKSGK